MSLKLIQCNCNTGGAKDFFCGMFSQVLGIYTHMHFSKDLWVATQYGEHITRIL